MMFRFPSVICTRCTGFFCLAIIKGPPNDIYCTIEEPSKHYFTEKVSYSLKIIQFGPSLLHLRSIMSKKRRVFSISKMLLPISSIIRQEGLTKPDMALLSVPVLRAFVNFSFNSVAFIK